MKNIIAISSLILFIACKSEAPKEVVLNPINKEIKKQFVCETGDMLYWKSILEEESQ